MSLLYIFFFITGAIVGSFLNVVIDRIDTGESIIKGRSYCSFCRKKLSWWELIPIFSFFALKGKCFSCKQKISCQYPIVEFLTALFFILAVWRFFRFPFSGSLVFSAFQVFRLEYIFVYLNFLFWFYWVCVFIVIAAYDFKKYLILNEVLLPAIGLSLLWKIISGFLLSIKAFHFFPQTFLLLGSESYLFGNYSYFTSLFLGIIFSCGFISLLVFLTKEKAMGWGDAILAFFIGVILGWPEAVIALIIAFLTGSAVAIVLMLFRKKTLKSYLPFAPFLSLGALSILFLGDIIIKGYLSLLF